MRVIHYQGIMGAIVGTMLLSACASYQLQYPKGSQPIQLQENPGAQKIAHTMYLIGDAGNTEAPDSMSKALALLKKKLENATENSSVIFLGDNIYPNGMAPKSAPEERSQDEYRLQAQLDILKDFPGKVFFIAGNHDWYGYGLEGLKRQRKFIEDYLDEEAVFLPKPGCGDPVEIELNENLVLVLIDSQWWLENWEGETEINDGCDIKSRKVFQQFFEEAIKGNRNKNIVIALHHPPYTQGPHGGQYTLRDHIFPLTAVRKNLWIPMPIVGSLYPLLRATIGSNQDMAHPDYQKLMDILTNSARKNGSFIFASGHEHSLQYLEKDNQSFIVSGAGSKRNPTRLKATGELSYGQQGFAQLDFYEDGTTWLRFYAVDKPDGALIFQKKIKDALPLATRPVPTDFPELDTIQNEITVPLSTYDFQRGALWRFLWGNHFRRTYATQMTVPVLKLSAFKGGVVPIKLGGGNQTSSLRLQDTNKRQYAIRSLDKDATRVVPYPFNESFALTIVKDNFSSSHPLSALPVTALAKSLNIYHTNPGIFYLPRQPLLDRYNDLFGGALYLVEERPSGDWSNESSLGNAPDFIGTLDLAEAITTDNKAEVDQQWTVRTRLLDMLIGDWDRHDDQWRWAEFPQGEQKLYRPVPRDRDQAFSKYDGLILGLIRQFSPSIRALRPYNSNIRTIKWANWSARYFDHSFLNELNWEDWLREVQFLQQQLTDELIETAFRESFPAEIYQRDAPKMIQVLKFRRDHLIQIAQNHYKLLSTAVDVVGTDKRELFVIERLNDDSTRVSVFDTNKNKERQRKLYERIFLTKDTREIRLYGLDGDDFFEISGTADKGIRIRAIGGLGEDHFTDHSEVYTQGKKTILYDAKDEKNVLNIGAETRNRISDDPNLNTYNRRGSDYEFDYGYKLPFVAGNPDDGLLLGGLLQHTTYGFKKAPYAARHTLSGRYALATSGMGFNYRGEFINVLGKWDFQLNAEVNTPLYAINFYGFGNDTPDPEEELEENFNRVRQRLVRLEPSLLSRVNSAFSWSVGPTFESIRIDRTPGRLIDAIGDDFDPELFDGLEFVGVRFQMNLKNVNNQAFPSNGIGWRLDAGWKLQLDNTDKHFPYLQAALTLYQQLAPSGNLVFATRVGVWHNFNNKFEFYQGATLGGGLTENANFRGVRRERFTGQTSFYNNIDLRLRLFSSENRTLPFAMGIFGGFDHGRVWLQNEDSDTWHYAYGGGLFFMPFEIAAIQAGVFRSDDQRTRFTFGGGFFF